MLVRLQNFRLALVRSAFIKLLTNTMSGWSRGSSSYNRNADRLRDRLAASRNETLEAGSSQSHRGKHPPGLRGRDIGEWYRNNQTSRNKDSEPKVVRLVSSMTFASLLWKKFNFSAPRTECFTSRWQDKKDSRGYRHEQIQHQLKLINTVPRWFWAPQSQRLYGASQSNIVDGRRLGKYRAQRATAERFQRQIELRAIFEDARNPPEASSISAQRRNPCSDRTEPSRADWRQHWLR